MMLSACAKTQSSEKDAMPMILIPSGDFLMGSASSAAKAQANEFPQHTVYLDGYTIDQHEVTNAQYALCVKAGACTPPQETSSYSHPRYYGTSKYANFPVIKVNWNQAASYCTWAGRRLPTEAEWEKAARGTDGRIYPWGNEEPDATLENLWQNEGDTTKVCSYPKGNSPYGLCDMAGNVWEWVNDWYGETYYQYSPASNPTGPASSEYRIIRGGSWYLGPQYSRSEERDTEHPDDWYFSYGFRCSR